ncbi:MAG: acyl-CoA desaturase [Pseudomonadota bacterium]
MSRYENNRIADNRASATAARVYIDPIKLFWVGGMLLLGTVGAALTASISAVFVFVFSTAVTLLFGHSLGMHRRFIHRSYQCPRWLEYAMVHLGVLVGIAGPLGMLRTHDLRDWAQRQAECHDYFSHGSEWWRDAWWQMLCSVAMSEPPDIDPEPVIADDRVYYWMERTWMLQQLPWAVLFFAIGGWGWVCWGIGARVSVSVLGHWLVGYFAHNHGQRHWHVDEAAVQGHNVPWTSLLTMGECWHNNHHAFPGSARLGLEAGQWDPGWWTLRLMARVGLASDFVLPQDLPERDELAALTTMTAPQANVIANHSHVSHDDHQPARAD